MESKNLAIGVLSTTAVILFVGLVLVQTQPAPVYASGMGDGGGDYVIVSGALWDREEILYVIDSELLRLRTYKYDLNRNTIAVGPGEELQRYFNPQGNPTRRRRP